MPATTPSCTTATEPRTNDGGSDSRDLLRAGCDFPTEMAPGIRERADALVDKHLTARKHRKRREIRSVPGSKGARRYNTLLRHYAA